MNYTLGQKLVHFVGGEKEGHAIVVAIRRPEGWEIVDDYQEDIGLAEFLGDTSHDVVLSAEVDWDEALITEHDLDYYDSWNEGTDWTVLVTEESYNKRQEVSKKITELLKANNIDTKNLIVHNGDVYQGGGECESFIQTSHTWCSSSMLC